MTIGEWAKRANARPEGKWHLIESIIADSVITRCGRRMASTSAHGSLDISPVEPLTRAIGQPQLCRTCS